MPTLEATSSAPPTTLEAPPIVPATSAPLPSESSITISNSEQIQQHLGILPPPEHDMPSPSEPIAPYEEEETTTAEVKTPIQSTQETTTKPSRKNIPWRVRFTGVVPHAKDIAPSKSLPSVGNSRKSYLKVTSQRLARGKLVHLHGRRSLALPSVGPGLRNHFTTKANLAAAVGFHLEALSFQRAAYIGQLQEEIHNTVQKGCEIISQQKGDFATLCKMLPSA
ncbi:hypothetical protein AAG906_005899 [Vitis piasezkii]